MRVIFLALALLSGFGCSTIVRTTLPFNDLPAPGGPFAVGMGIETWTDTSRPETFTVNPTDSRRIVVQYWYPAEDQTEATAKAKEEPKQSINPTPTLTLINPTKG